MGVFWNTLWTYGKKVACGCYATIKGLYQWKRSQVAKHINEATELLNWVSTRYITAAENISLNDGLPSTQRRKILLISHDLELRYQRHWCQWMNIPFASLPVCRLHHLPFIRPTPPWSYWDSPKARQLFSTWEGKNTAINQRTDWNTKIEIWIMDPSTLGWKIHILHEKQIAMCFASRKWTWNKCNKGQ